MHQYLHDEELGEVEETLDIREAGELKVTKTC
jgi:hypothetical protein